MAQRGSDQADNTNHRHPGGDRLHDGGQHPHEATQHVDRVALLKEGTRPNNGAPGAKGVESPAAKPGSGDSDIKFSNIYHDTVSPQKTADGQPKPVDGQPKPADGQPKTADTATDDSHTRGLNKHDRTHDAKHPKKPAKGDHHDGDKPHEKPDAKPAKPGDKHPAKPEDKKPAEAPDSIKVLNDDKNFNKNNPTIAYLDDFSKRSDNVEPKLDGKNGPSHGEFQARAVEQNGFNAYRIQSQTQSPDGGKHEDYSKALNSIADKVDSGQLKLGKGDAVNVSMGHTEKDMTFEQANKFLGTKDLNAENLKERRGEILDKLGEVANDPKRSADDRAWAKTALDTNKAIDRLQEKGIHVMHAGGNDNNATDKRFSMDFMKASDELGSNKPNGKPDAFSADHSLMADRGKTDGVYTFKYNGMDALSKQPVADQKGFYKADGANIRFEGSEFGQRLGDGNKGINMDRSKFFDNGTLPANAGRDTIDSSALSPNTSGPEQKFSNDSVTKWNPNQFGGPTTSPYFGDLKKASNIKVDRTTNFSGDKPEAGTENSAAYAAGTSFSNIRYAIGKRDQWMMEKAQAQ